MRNKPNSKTVLYFSACSEEDYPSIDYSVNTVYEWPDLYNLAEVEAFDWLNVDLFIKANREFDILRFDGHLLLSSKARMIIDGVAPSQCLWFPVRINREPFYLMWITNVIDCLDVEKSKVKWFGIDKKRIRSVESYVFKKELLNGPSIFKIPQYRVPNLASTEIQDAVSRNQLQGWRFVDCENVPAGERLY